MTLSGRRPASSGCRSGSAAESPGPIRRPRWSNARALLDAHAPGCLYARVDVVATAERFVLMEVELLEPSLYFEHHPPSARAFALAIQRIA